MPLVFLSCKNKKKKEDKNGPFYTVLPFLNEQVKTVDSSLYRITKITSVDSISDTAIIAREAFRATAQDFLTIPDISAAAVKEGYNESDSYDELLKNVILTYTAKDPEAEIQRETVMLEPDESGNSKVKTIIIDRVRNQNDSTIVKNMLWEVNKSFQVITKTQWKDRPEKISTLLVKWE
jgi:hypothetical protein